MTKQEALDLIRTGDMYDCKGYLSDKGYEALHVLEEVEVVPVVRCKDCKWYGTYQLTKYGECDKRYKPSVCIKGEYSIMRNEDWFCADGERKGRVTNNGNNQH